MPVRVTLEAFNPFIPLNATDSGIPVAILNYRLKNNSPDPVDAMLVGESLMASDDIGAAVDRLLGR